MSKRKKSTSSVLLVLLAMVMMWSGLPMQGAHAANGQASQIDAVLVVDVSNSMKTSDTNKIGNEAMKMFIDMLSVSGDRVGIVAYTDKIEREKALLEINTPSDKEDLKQFIDGLNRGPYTDIAVGVKEAIKVLQNGADPNHDPMIVVLADGNNDFNKSSGRTAAQSDQELSAAVEEAKQAGIPIYTIGLNADGKLNKEALADLSDKTGAKSFSTSSAEDLPQILSEIFASHLKLKIVPIQSLTGNGNFQEVTVNVPNGNVLEANISIMSNQPVETELINPSGDAVTIPSDEVLMTKSKSYSLLKLLHPGEGDWTLRVKGVSKDKIDINLVFNYDLELALEPLPSAAYKQGDEIAISSYLTSNGQKLADAEMYKNMTAVLKVKDLDAGTTEEIALTNTGDKFEGTYKIPEEHEYELVVRAEEKSFYRESPAVNISAKPGASSVTPPATPEKTGTEEEKPFPFLLVILIILGALVLLAGGYFLLRKVQQSNRGFVGQIVIEIRDENTGDKTYPQYKKLTAFRGKFTLHQLLQLAPELKETEEVIFTPGSNDRIMLTSKSGGTVERSGRAVDTSKGLELKSGDRLTLPLSSVDKTIFIEYLV